MNRIPPLVSIAVPAYRHEKYVETCLASICQQTYPELELVLIDDGSPDDTFQIANRFLERRRDRFRRIVLERRDNRGVSANSNACIEACSGEWVHLIGSDDRLYPEKISRVQSAIERWKLPELALVHTDTDTIDAEGRVRPIRKADRHAPPGPDHAAYRWLFHRNLISNPSIALRREAFLGIGGFDPSLPLEDIDCWLRLSTHYAIARVPEVLASYRKHPGNSLRQRQKMLGAFFITYAKFLEANPNLIPASEVRRHFRWYLSRFWRRIRNHAPQQLSNYAAAMLSSYFWLPTPDDYRRFGEILLDAAK